MKEEKNNWCSRCQEEFPIAEDVHEQIRMGKLYELQRFSKEIRGHYEVKSGTGSYLCGNCYYDLTD